MGEKGVEVPSTAGSRTRREFLSLTLKERPGNVPGHFWLGGHIYPEKKSGLGSLVAPFLALGLGSGRRGGSDWIQREADERLAKEQAAQGLLERKIGRRLAIELGVAGIGGLLGALGLIRLKKERAQKGVASPPQQKTVSPSPTAEPTPSATLAQSDKTPFFLEDTNGDPPLPPDPEVPRKELFPSQEESGKMSERQILEVFLFRSGGAFSHWEENSLINLFVRDEETFLGSEVYSLFPDGDRLERAKVFARAWNEVCRALDYPSPDPFSPLDKLPENLKEVNYPSPVIESLGVILWLCGEEVNKENILFLCDLLNFHLLVGNPYETILFKPQDLANVEGALNKTAEKTGLNPFNSTLIDPRVKFLFLNFGLRALLEFGEDRKRLDNYLAKARTEPKSLADYPTDFALQEAVERRKQALKKGQLGREQPAREEKETAISFWLKEFGISERTFRALLKREAGSLEDSDGVLQVTKAVREGSYQRIPVDYLWILVNQEPRLTEKYRGKKLVDLKSTVGAIDHLRREVLKLYSQKSEPIQIFWGLWVWHYRCQQYGEYLSFLSYNHPAAVESGGERPGLVNQLRAALNVDKETAIKYGNQLIERLDRSIRGKQADSGLNWRFQPGICYERDRDRFYWGFDLEGEAEIADQKMPFLIRSAHYLWQMEGFWPDKNELIKYGEKAIEYACKFPENKDRKEELRKKLFTNSGEPNQFLQQTLTSTGIMDLL